MHCTMKCSGLLALSFLAVNLIAANLHPAFAAIPEDKPATATTAATVTVADPGTEGDGEIKIAPPYSNAPEMKVKEGVPVGAVHDFTMKSEDSAIYPGLKGPYKRKVTVYIPKQYVPGTPAPFMVVQDAMNSGDMIKILDNMIHEKRVPAMIGVFIVSGGGDGQGSERGLEYYTLSDKYSTFIETEVLPKIEKDYNVKFTTDPEGRGTMGGSSGAACAFTMAWYHPELYHKVLSYSGTYVNQQSPKSSETPHGAWEYHEHLIPQTDKKPIRIWMEVGEDDIGANKDEASYHNWVMANDRMAKVLKDKGYHHQYVWAGRAKHVDGGVIRQTLPGALEWLWRGYPVK